MLGCTLYHDECSILKYQCLLLCIILRGNKIHLFIRYAWAKWISWGLVIFNCFNSTFVSTPFPNFQLYVPCPCTKCAYPTVPCLLVDKKKHTRGRLVAYWFRVYLNTLSKYWQWDLCNTFFPETFTVYF